MSDQNNVSSPEMLDFLKSPVKDMPAISSVKEKLSIFIPLFLLEIVIAIFCGGIISQLTNGLHLMEGNKLEHFFNAYPFWVVFIYVALVGPMIEELFFRLPLKMNEKYAQINVVLTLTGFIYILVFTIKVYIIQISLVIVEIILLSVYFNSKKLFNKYIINIWNKKFTWVFYISAGTFGMLHISNYSPKFIIFLLMPILVLPQFIVGLFCGYIRIRLGFFWGYFLHAAHNFVFIVPFLITTLISVSNSQSVKITEHDNMDFSNTWKITKDTILFDRDRIGDIVSKLIPIGKDSIDFEDQKIADKILTLKYIRKSQRFTGKSISSSAFVLNELLRKYKLKIERIPVDKEIYELEIIDSVKLDFKTRNLKDSIITTSIPYLTNDEIILHNVDFKFLARSMDQFYSKQVVDSTNNHNKYTIQVPRIGFNKLNKFFEDQYGFRFNRKYTKVTGYRITSRKDK
jgi:hypothetical protein